MDVNGMTSIEDLEERLEALETEHAVLSDRFNLQMEFVIGTLAAALKDEGREFVRQRIESRIVIARQAMLLDDLNHLQDLLRMFDAARVKL